MTRGFLLLRLIPAQAKDCQNCAATILYAVVLLLAHIQFGNHLAQMFDLGKIVHRDIRLIRMMHRVVLVVGLRRIKRLQRDYLRDNGLGKNFGLIQLVNVGQGNALLLVPAVKPRRTLLRAGVRSLAVQLRGIMRHGKIHLEQLPVRNLRRVIDDFYGLSVSGPAGADGFIFSGAG